MVTNMAKRLAPGFGLKPCLLLFFLAILWPALHGSEAQEPEAENSFTLDEEAITTLPGAIFYPTFLENLAPGAVLLLEESNGFSLIDDPRVYFEGDSFLQFPWTLDGWKINSALHDGAPAFLPPASALAGYQLAGETPMNDRHGLDFSLRQARQNGSRLILSAVPQALGEVGAYIPWLAKALHNPHVFERTPDIRTARRRLDNNAAIDYSVYGRGRGSNWLLSLGYFTVDRLFNDFNDEEATFAETAKRFHILSRYHIDRANGSLEFTAAYQQQQRQHLGAELGRLPQETGDDLRHSGFLSAILRRPSLRAGLSWQWENEEQFPSGGRFFAKDLCDIDGEGILTPATERWGNISAQTLRGEIWQSLTAQEAKSSIDLYAEAAAVFATGQEFPPFGTPLYFNGEPYQVIRWRPGSDYSNQRWRTTAGARFSVPLSPTITFQSRLFASLQALRYQNDANDITALSPGFDLGLHFSFGHSDALLLAYSQMPYELGSAAQTFLESERPAGTIYYWNDPDHDGRYTPGEEGDIYGTSGGPYHSRDANLRLPGHSRLLADFSFALSPRFRLTLKGLYKRIRNSFWVRFTEEYGTREPVGDQELYFFDRPFSEYVLGNYAFEKKPFYAEFLLHLAGAESERWRFSFSLMAHIGMGVTAFGNGAGANDIGLIDESQANPNSWINGFGRLDGDRAFVIKLFYERHLSRRLILAASVKYRDGDPFAFIRSVYGHGQWVLYYQTIKAENEKMIKGGPREDFVSDVSLQLTYRFRLFGARAGLYLAGFNLLDLASELSENVFSGGERLGNELQLPRSLRLGLTLDW